MVNNISFMLLVAAAFCFGFAVIGVPVRVNLIALGLLLVTLSVMAR